MLICVISNQGDVAFADCENKEPYRKQIEYLSGTVLSHNLVSENGSSLIPPSEMLINEFV